jgi:D-alanyl-D-alanine endopeptidase (penicillin-binding protein 7)
MVVAAGLAGCLWAGGLLGMSVAWSKAAERTATGSASASAAKARAAERPSARRDAAATSRPAATRPAATRSAATRSAATRSAAARRGGSAASAAAAPRRDATRAARPASHSASRDRGTRTVATTARPRSPAAGTLRVVARPAAPPRPSIGQLAGLHATDDPLDLHSSVALVVDQQTDEVLLSKNPDAVLPIASLTKLMTALVVAEAQLALDETLTINQADVDTEKGSRSRLPVGSRLSRGDLLHLALMSSENRAASALGRHFPGGEPAFVRAMNAQARELGMTDTEFVEATGLSSRNRSSARDLSLLVKAAYRHPMIRELSTSSGTSVEVGERRLNYHNTNRLVAHPGWSIGLQKTGYISEAGRCLVMQAEVGGRQLIMVFLDSSGRHARLGDAERVRQWMVGGAPGALAAEPMADGDAAAIEDL